MGINFKAVLTMFVALVGLNYLRGFMDAQAWMPQALKRADGVGVDDLLDAGVLLLVIGLVHKVF